MRWESQKAVVNLEEIWREGAVLDCEIGFPPGTSVEIHAAGRRWMGIATSVQEYEFGFHIEVEFSTLTPWRIEDFRPLHLLNPAELKARDPRQQ